MRTLLAAAAALALASPAEATRCRQRVQVVQQVQKVAAVQQVAAVPIVTVFAASPVSNYAAPQYESPKSQSDKILDEIEKHFEKLYQVTDSIEERLQWLEKRAGKGATAAEPNAVAAPPAGTELVTKVCGQCHQNTEKSWFTLDALSSSKVRKLAADLVRNGDMPLDANHESLNLDSDQREALVKALEGME